MENKILEDKEIMQIISSKEELMKVVTELEVNSKEKEITAVDLTSQINRAIKKVEDLRKCYTTPLYDMQKSINRQAKEVKDPFEEMEKVLRKKCIDYHNFLEEQARKEKEKYEKKMEKALENNKPMPVEKPIQAETKIQSENATMSYTKKWTFEITDESKIPTEYLIPDVIKIRKMVQAGIRSVPGLRIYEEVSSSLRRN